MFQLKLKFCPPEKRSLQAYWWWDYWIKTLWFWAFTAFAKMNLLLLPGAFCLNLINSKISISFLRPIGPRYPWNHLKHLFTITLTDLWIVLISKTNSLERIQSTLNIPYPSTEKQVVMAFFRFNVTKGQAPFPLNHNKHCLTNRLIIVAASYSKEIQY